MAFDVREYAKKRTEDKANGNKSNGGFDVREYAKQRNLPQVGEYINSSINDWLKKNESFYAGYNNRIGRYQDKDVLDWSYESDSSDWLSSLTTQKGNLEKEASEIKGWLDQYKGYLSEDYYNSVIEALDGNLNNYNDIISQATDINKHWSAWDTEDAYNEWITQQKDYNEKLNYDLEAGQTEVADIQRLVDQWDEAMSESNALKISIAQKEQDLKYGHFVDREKLQSEINAEKNKLAGYEQWLKFDGATAKKDLEEKKAYLTLAERIQKAEELASVADVESENYDPAFAEKSQYNSTQYAKGLDSFWDRLTKGDEYGMGYADLTYEYINGDEDFRAEVRSKYNTYSSDNSYNDGKSRFEEAGYDYMEDDEIAIYNYYYNTEGKEKAEEYLDSLEESLQYRYGTAMAQGMEGKPVSQYIFAVEAGLDQFSTGVASIFSDEYTPANATQIASGKVREDLADTGAKLPDWLGGGSLGQVGYDVINTTSNMLPSILASTAVNMVAPGAGAVVGTGLLGASAGGNAKSEMLQLGYSKEQANTYGVMVAIAEGGMEYLLGGIGALGGKASGGLTEMILSKIDNAFARTAIKIGSSMASEGLEEGLQTVIEPWLKEYATGVDWDDPSIDEVLYSSLLGALSAFGLEGAGTVAGEVNTYKQGKNVQNVYAGVEKLQNIGTTFSADTVAYKIASKVNAQTDAYTIGRLLSEVGGTISEQNLTDIVNGLTAKGIDATTANKLAKQYQAILNSEMRLTDEGVKILENLSPLADVLRTNIIGANTTVYQRTRAYSDLMSLADDVANGKKGKTTEASAESVTPEDKKKYISDVEKIAAEVASGRRISASDVIKKSVNSKNDLATEKLGVEGRYTSSETGRNRLASNKQRVNIVGVDSIKDGTLKLKLDDGSVVDAKDIDFSSSNEALVYEAIANMGVSANTAWEILKGYNPKSGQSGAIYAMGALEAYTYGHNGVKVDGMSKDGFSALLSDVQKNTANRLGDIDARAKIEAQQKTIDKAVKSVRDEAKSKHKAIPKRNGETVFEGDRARLTALQESQLGVLEKVASGLGVTFHIFESKVDAEGKRYYTMPNGKITSANGWYDPKTGEIWIDLHAGNDGQGTMIFTAAHELTHFIRQWSPAKFKVFADFLFEQYGKKGQDVNQLIRDQMKKAADNGRSLSWDEAYEEVIADSCETFLRDSKAAEKIAALREKDAGLANKIKTFLGQMLAKLRKLMADLGLAPETKEGKMVAEMTDSLEKLYDLWTDALADAGKAYSTLAEIDLDTESVAPMLSERTWTASEYVTEREETAKQISKALGVDIKTAYKYIDDINSVARLIADDRARLDYEPNLDEHATVLKPNSEYKYSVDMSTLCAKRLLFTGTFDAIQRALPNTVFDSEDIVALREMMQDRGYEVACGICYVESTRREIGRITQEFIDRYKVAQKTGNPISRINSSGKEVVLKSAGKTFSADKNYTPNLGELNTTDIDIVKRDHPEVYDAYLAFMNARGQAKPKLLETRAEYKGEILKHFKAKSAVEARNNSGGLRLQSFSDFEVPHLIDMMQVVMDMARVGLKSQAYTKVPAFAEVFGDTGVKINLSLIAKGDGLDANGNLVFDDVEGINHKEAFKLRDKYSKNVGTILVGKTDAHIIAAMADSRIDYIIPFHKSSWKESLYDALGLTGYADYTDYQNEKPIDKDRKIKNFDPSEYWDFSKSGDENTQIYLAKCREDGRIPKFPQFQGYPGYWKLLIDFKMYDNDGVGSPQEVVRPTFNTEASERILSEYKGGHKSFPVAKDVVEDFVKEHQTKFSDRDSLGNELSEEQQEYFKDSKVRDKKGNLMVLYHGTTANFNTFKKGDVGFHFGTKAAARGRVGFGKNVTLKEVYLNITNPIVFDEDLGSWDADYRLTRELYDKGILTQAEAESVLFTDDRQYKRTTEAANKKLASILLEKGYDGIAYSNTLETKKPTTSYIIFQSNQAKDITNKTPTPNADIRYSDREFSEDFTANTLDSFGIQKPGDYIHVQRQVFNTLLNEGFFTNAETRSRTDTNEESGMVIETNKSGIDETFSLNNFVRLGKFKKIAKLATIRELPNAIKHGHMVEDDAANKYDSTDKNKAFAYIEYATKVDGKEIVVKLAIKKSPQKNKFWVHSIYTIENVSDSPASTNEGAEAGHITADSKGIITHSEEIVNRDTKKNSLRTVEPIETADYVKMYHHFGSTKNYDVAGYILGNGTMLDFSGKHWGDKYSTSRQVDHRDIQETLGNRGSNNGVNAMIDMIGNGNIRLMPEVGGINLAVKPNSTQMSQLRGYINHFKGEVTIDIDEVGGDTIHSFSYTRGTSSAKVLADIKAYFDEGIVPEQKEEGDTDIRQFLYSDRVADKKTVDFLDKQLEKGEYDAKTNPDGGYYVTYKSMSFWGYDEDGNAILRSPMAEYVDGKLSGAYLIPKDKNKHIWYQATETIDENTGLPSGLLVKVKVPGKKNPNKLTAQYLPASENQHLIKDDWSNLYFNLKKKIFKNGKWEDSDVPARYNPYEHSSNSMLNDQFAVAYLRDNLVTVKMYVPVSEDNGTYRATWSKDPTGWTDWKTGVVAGKIGQQKDLKRRLYLSRYATPVEIVPDSEVAQAYKGYLDGTDVAIPDNVVSPNLLKELKKIGVPIKESGKLANDGNKFSDRDSTYMDAVNRGDMETAQKMVDEAAKEAGYTRPLYHGTADKFNVFKFGRAGIFTTDNYDMAKTYGNNIISLYGKQGANVLTIDAEGSPHYAIRVSKNDLDFSEYPLMRGKELYSTNNISQIAFREGYDVVVIKNVYDNFSITSDNKQNGLGTDVVYRDSNQVKSAEPVTYDDNGNIIPLSQRFNSENDDIRYSDRSPSSVSTRSLLANALESTAQNDIERNKLEQYKSKIDLIESEYAKLSEIKKKANEIRFTKGRTSAETKKMKALDFEANQIANRINVYDRQLLNLESTTALKNVLQREKELARKKEAQKGKEALAKRREQEAKTIRTLMDKNAESRKKAIEGRDKTAMRHKIRNIVDDLNKLLLNPTKDKHIPISLQKPVASALAVINMDTVGAEERIAKYNELIAKSKNPDEIARLTKSRDNIELQGENLKDKLTALQNAYAALLKSDDPLVQNAHDEAIEILIANTVDKVGDTSLRNMSLEQLEAVYDMFKAIKATVRNTNKMFKEGKQETITANSEWAKREISAAGGHRDRVLKATKFLKKFGWNMLKPIYAMKLIGSDILTGLYENVRKGEDTWAVDVNEAKDFFKETAKKYEYNTWDFKKQYKFTDSAGHSFSLSIEQIMSLYAYSKRSQADKHLENGGFIFDDSIGVTKKTKLGIPLKYEVNDANPYRLRKDALGKIISILDTDLNNVKGFVDEMQAYLSDVMGAKGNEVSLAMYDIKLYKEKNYFPLKTAKYFRAFDPEKNGTPKIKNSGFSKNTVPQAGNPIILANFMDVWANHVNDMSMYHAFVLPLEDFMRVYNYSSTMGGYDSVQQYIKNAYGAQANTYIETLMSDLNGGARTDPATDFISKGMSLFKKAAVFASASVVIQQPSAIARAMAYIDAKYFVDKPEASKHSETWAEVKKYAPVAIIKEMGYFDTNMGRSTVDWIKEEKTWRDKVDDLASKAPALADELAWCAIWKAVKREIADSTNLEVGSEGFLKMAGKRFTEVVTKTQVYDSVLSRSALMRSKDSGAKMVTAFMAEPTTSLNMVVDAIIEGKRGDKKFAKKAVGAVAASIILNSILVSLVTAARDDDEDETYLEKYLESLTAELLDGFNPLTYIPLVKDIWSIMQGFDIERSDMSIWSDLWQSVENLFSDNKSGFEKTEGVVGSIASIFGLPLKNLMRDARGLFNLAFTLFSGTPTTWAGVGEAIGGAIKSSIPLYSRIEKWAGADNSKSDKLYDAIISGDQAHIDRLKSQYKDEEAIESAIKQALRENDSRIKEAAKALASGSIRDFSNYIDTIVAEGHFDEEMVESAIRSELNAFNTKINEAAEAKNKGDEEEYKKIVRDLRDSYKGVYSQDEIVNLVKKAQDEQLATDDDEDVEEATSIYKASDINDAFESGDTDTALEVIDDLFNTKVENYLAEARKEAEKNGKTFNERKARQEAESKAKSSIRSSMTSYWKPLYKEAYKSGNTAEKERIERILKASGLYGSASEVIKTCREWRTERD